MKLGMGQRVSGLLVVIAAALLAGCRGGEGESSKPAVRLRVLCSTFPMYLFTRHVTDGQDGIAVDLMLPAAVGCPHDYVLTPADMTKLAAADVFIANGLGMEEFLGEPLKKANPRIRVIDTSAGIGGIIQLNDEDEAAALNGKPDAAVPRNGKPEAAHTSVAPASGLPFRETADERQASASESGHHHTGANPHLFADPRMAGRIARNIAAGLAGVDPAGADRYKKNAAACAARMDKLADDFAAGVKKLRSVKIVTEHGVFDYLARDCGLEIVAVVEEAPGQEPAAARMLQIVKTIRASGAAAVFTEPQYPGKVSRTIAREAGVPVAVLDPVASGPDDAPLDYYEKIMRTNLQTLTRTLGEKTP